MPVEFCANNNCSLNQVLPAEATPLDQAQYWVFDHPTTIKALEAAGFLGGIALMAAAPYSFAAYGAIQAIGMGLSGGLMTAVSLAAYKVLDLLAAPAHDMKTHVFTPGECEGGKLYYEGDVPILTLDADNPFLAGHAHGYLLGDSLNRLFRQLDFARHTLQMRPRAAHLTDLLANVKETIPQEYLLEMEGLLAGYKKWSRQHPFSFPMEMTLDDLVLLHLLPDSIHFNPIRPAYFRTREAAIACSAVIDKDENGKLRFMRNMDWPPFGMAGAYSLIINRKSKTRLSTAEVGLPGFIGAITGMNERGLSLAMNVRVGGTDDVRGMPAVFFNRLCLENHANVCSLDAFLNCGERPLGPYHLTAADSDEACSFHFYQGHGDKGLVKRPWSEGSPLITLNYRYPTSYMTGYSMENSEEREEVLKAWFEKAEPTNLPKSEAMERCTSLPYVNNWETTHSVNMDPESKSMFVSFNNGWAAKYPHHQVPTGKLFG